MKKPAIKKIAALAPGTQVGIVNCVTNGVVIDRPAPNVYRVQWKGHILTLPRTHIVPSKGILEL